MRTNNKIRAVTLPPIELAEIAPPMPKHLTPDELEEVATYVFGPDRWKLPMARVLGVSRSTVNRWATGESPVTGPVIAALWLLAGRHPVQVGTYGLTHRPPRRRARVRRMPKVQQVERYLLP